MLKISTIEATTLEDSWYQAIYKCVDEGKKFIVDKGSFEGQYRLELDFLCVHIKSPWIEPLLPSIPSQYNIPDPVDQNYLNSYLPYLLTGDQKDGEIYTYGRRLNNVDIFGGDCINQINYIIDHYKNNKSSRTNQMVLQIAQPSDILLDDPPCLRSIFTRVQDGKLHFHPYFRSNDLYGGFPANLAAIELLKQYMAECIGIENGEIIYFSSGSHVYDYVFDIVETLRGRKINENN